MQLGNATCLNIKDDRILLLCSTQYPPYYKLIQFAILAQKLFHFFRQLTLKQICAVRADPGQLQTFVAQSYNWFFCHKSYVYVVGWSVKVLGSEQTPENQQHQPILILVHRVKIYICLVVDLEETLVNMYMAYLFRVGYACSRNFKFAGTSSEIPYTTLHIFSHLTWKANLACDQVWRLEHQQ